MDVIGQLATTLGVDNPQAESVAGAVLGTLQRNAPEGALDDLLKRAPEASAWLQKAGPRIAGAAPAGLAGTLPGAVSGGGLAGAVKGAAALEAVATGLQKVGVPPEMAARAVPVVLRYLEDKLGGAGFAALAEQTPFLKDLSAVRSDSLTSRLQKGALSALGGRLLE